MNHISKLIKLEKNDKRYGYYAIKAIPKHSIILVEKAVLDLYNEPKFYEMFQILYKIFHNKKLKERFCNLLPDNAINNKLFTYDDLKIDLETLCKNSKIRDYLLKIAPEELELYCLKYLRNGFGTEEPLILFHGAMFNHSCIPNVLFIQKGNIMYFITTRDIKEKEELFDSYIDLPLNKKDRRERLLNQYGFICLCERCMKETQNHKKFLREISSMSENIENYKLV